MWLKSGIWTVYVQSGENAYRTLNRRLYCKLFSSKIWWDDEKQHVFQLYEALFVFDMVSCLVDLSADSRHHDRFLPLSTPSLSSVSSLRSVCLQHTLTMQFFFFLSFLKPSSKWKTSWSSVWRADTVLLASPQKCTSISFFFLSVSCVLERTECGSSTPFPTLNNRHTQSFCLTQLFLFCCLSPAGLRD